MSDEFDPNWPHGHLLKYESGQVTRARIIDTSLPGEEPLAVHIDDGTVNGFLTRMTTRGKWGPSRLINAPAPVKHAEAWVNVYRWSDGSLDVTGGTHGSLQRAREFEPNNYLGSIRISTETADIIGPNGEVVKL